RRTVSDADPTEMAMKLVLNKTSPYARLVLVTAHEAGVGDRIELIWAEPEDDPPELLALNPLGKVPALLTDDGVALVESTCICEHLVANAPNGAALVPREPAARTAMLRRLGLGRGAIDCAFGAVIQRRFDGNADSPLSQRWLRALPRTAAALETIYAQRAPATAPDLGDLAVAVAFDYIDFRLPEIGWRDSARHLARYVDAVRERPSMHATRP